MKRQVESYLEAEEKDTLYKLNEELIEDYIIKWRKILVIICTVDFAILRPKLYKLCDFLLVVESGQSKRLQSLILASRMTIKTLFLFGDTEQILPYRMHSMC